MSEPAEARPVWAWIDHDALRHNARRAIECAAGRRVVAVVKANAYGHGAAEVARSLLGEGISRLAVVSVAEGAELRRAGIVAPLLLLGGLDDAAMAERAVKWGLTPVIHDPRGFELARSFGRADSPLSVEAEIDTGMRRMGIEPDAVRPLLARIVDAPQLSLTGVFTHLVRSEEADPIPSREQVDELGRCLEELGPSEVAGLEVHVVNSAGLLRRAEIEDAQSAFETTAVRPGLMLYGASPFADRTAEALDLEPVMTLAARVVAIRRVRKGETVGYGGEWRADRDTRVATLPLGYGDGIPRSILGRGRVHLAGAMRPIVGRVSMDYIGVDVGDAPVELGQVATLFGRTPEGERVPVEAFAKASGTIAYETLVTVGQRVPRSVGNGTPPAEGVAALDPAV